MSLRLGRDRHASDRRRQDPGELSDYKVVIDTSMAAFQRAIDYANTAGTGGDGFPLPATWIPSPTTFTAADSSGWCAAIALAFARTSRARRPSARAVNWDLVIADAQNGITADHINTTSTDERPVQNVGRAATTRTASGTRCRRSSSAWATCRAATRPGSRSRSVSAARGTRASSWLRPTCVSRREPIARRSRPTSRSRRVRRRATVCKRYFVNRPGGGDQFAGSGWGWSNYDFVRFHSWRVARRRRLGAQRQPAVLHEGGAGHAAGRRAHPEGQLTPGRSAHQRHAREERPAGDHGVLRRRLRSPVARAASRGFRWRRSTSSRAATCWRP